MGESGAIRVDKGDEFVGELMNPWAMRTVCGGFSRCGTPVDSLMAGSFNGLLRQEFERALAMV